MTGRDQSWFVFANIHLLISAIIREIIAENKVENKGKPTRAPFFHAAMGKSTSRQSLSIPHTEGFIAAAAVTQQTPKSLVLNEPNTSAKI